MTTYEKAAGKIFLFFYFFYWMDVVWLRSWAIKIFWFNSRFRQHHPGLTSMPQGRNCRNLEKGKDQWLKKNSPRWNKNWRRMWTWLLLFFFKSNFNAVLLSHISDFTAKVLWDKGLRIKLLHNQHYLSDHDQSH